MGQKRDNATIRMLGKAPAIASGEKTSSQCIVKGKAALTSLIVETDGTNDGTVAVFDGTSASGTTKVRGFTVPGDTHFGGNAINYPIAMDLGIFCTISGTGASYYADYIDLDE